MGNNVCSIIGDVKRASANRCLVCSYAALHTKITHRDTNPKSKTKENVEDHHIVNEASVAKNVRQRWRDCMADSRRSASSRHLLLILLEGIVWVSQEYEEVAVRQNEQLHLVTPQPVPSVTSQRSIRHVEYLASNFDSPSRTCPLPRTHFKESQRCDD